MFRRVVVALATMIALAVPTSALAFGPNPKEDSPALTNCVNAFLNQAAGGVSAGGGPKAGEPGPLNCDHFFQEVLQTIGNGWPPPPFQE